MDLSAWGYVGEKRENVFLTVARREKLLREDKKALNTGSRYLVPRLAAGLALPAPCFDPRSSVTNFAS